MAVRITGFLVVGLLLAAQAPQDASKKDLDRLQGDWVMQSNERGGKKLPEEQVRAYSRTIKGSDFTVLIQNEEGVLELKGTIALDPTQVPKRIDAKMTSGPSKGKTMLGIYKLEGETQTVCFAPPGQERPKAFDSTQGVLTVWKREKKRKGHGD